MTSGIFSFWGESVCVCVVRVCGWVSRGAGENELK